MSFDCDIALTWIALSARARIEPSLAVRRMSTHSKQRRHRGAQLVRQTRQECVAHLVGHFERDARFVTPAPRALAGLVGERAVERPGDALGDLLGERGVRLVVGRAHRQRHQGQRAEHALAGHERQAEQRVRPDAAHIRQARLVGGDLDEIPVFHLGDAYWLLGADGERDRVVARQAAELDGRRPIGRARVRVHDLQDTLDLAAVVARAVRGAADPGRPAPGPSGLPRAGPWHPRPAPWRADFRCPARTC